MVGESDPGNGHRAFLSTDENAANNGSNAPQAPPSKLTQELAQLLAASIAQGQARRSGSGAPTNSDLTSLANLVSAASSQRTLAPVFRDGLSALSYSPLQPQPMHGPSDEAYLAADDEPMPIPSTWREPAVHDDQRWFRQQMGAAGLGLIAGLLIVVPTVLWLSGWLTASPKSKPSAPPPMSVASLDIKAPEVKTVKVQVRQVERPAEGAAQYVTGSIDTPAPAAADALQPATQQASAASARVAEARSHADELLTQALRRVGSGDVVGARELLANEEAGGPGTISFALAETYDPNMLAAWGSRGVGSDVARAKALYRKALDLGVARAQARLDALR